MKDTFVMVLSFDFAEYNIYIVINTVQLFARIKLWTINLTYYGNCDWSSWLRFWINICYNRNNCMFNLLFSFKVSSVIEGTKSKRKVVTLTDGQASIDVKLWVNLRRLVSMRDPPLWLHVSMSICTKISGPSTQLEEQWSR